MIQTLNYIGKSNLMDALSFVLGISGQHLRSTNLKELIYHQGFVTTRSEDPEGIIDKENISGNVAVPSASKKPKKGRRATASNDLPLSGPEIVSSLDTACVSALYESADRTQHKFARR
jgi:hypothetical protein